jgi:hypothetical protein
MNEIREIIKYLVTMAVWLVAILVPGIAITTNDINSADDVLPSLIFFLGATVMTFFIWDGVQIILASIEHDRDEQGSKRKNENREADAAMLLLELLSDEERKALKRRLIQTNDGELPGVFESESSANHERDH